MSECSVFKKCPMCSSVWGTRDEFIDDVSLELNGYQVSFDIIEHGLFYFTHKVKGCNTTLALRAESFMDLNQGIKHNALNLDGEDCLGYCRRVDELKRCGAECEGSFIRDIISIIKERQAGVLAPV